MDYKASQAAGAMDGTSESDGEGDERSDSDYDSDGPGQAGPGQAGPGQGEDQAAQQSQRGDPRPDGGIMTRDGLGDGAGDQEQDEPAGMGWIGQPGQHGEWHPGLSRPDRG